MRLFYFLFIFASIKLSASVTLSLQGQLGNQLFQIATAVALAQENHCALYFPDFADITAAYLKTRDVEKHYNALFYRIPNRIDYARPTFLYSEQGFVYQPIPYRPNMEISGYFQSEKYFKKYRKLILELFAAPDEIEEDLQKHFPSVIEHPNTVGIHVRTWYNDFKNFDSNYKFYDAFLPPDMEYYKKAIDHFSPDALFVVFSDRIDCSGSR